MADHNRLGAVGHNRLADAVGRNPLVGVAGRNPLDVGDHHDLPDVAGHNRLADAVGRSPLAGVAGHNRLAGAVDHSRLAVDILVVGTHPLGVVGGIHPLAADNRRLEGGHSLLEVGVPAGQAVLQAQQKELPLYRDKDSWGRQSASDF